MAGPSSLLVRNIDTSSTAPPLGELRHVVNSGTALEAGRAGLESRPGNPAPSRPTSPSPVITEDSTMVFGSKPNAAQRRRNYANTNSVTDYEADLTHKDRTKQREALRRFLGERIKSDWIYEWPRQESGSSLDCSLQDATLPVPQEWKERDEWQSDASTSESKEDLMETTSGVRPAPLSNLKTDDQFEPLDEVSDATQKIRLEKKQRRRKRLAEELQFNDGLRCFVARRDAWTRARKVRRRKPSKTKLSPEGSVQNPASENTESLVSPISSTSSLSTTALDDTSDWLSDTEIPIAPPLIPPENAMRASVLPAAYNVIYDKVVVQSITPGCPLNLQDVVKSCVQGWKRDGQWPPKSTEPETLPTKRKVSGGGRKITVSGLFGWKNGEKNAVGDANDQASGEKLQDRVSGMASLEGIYGDVNESTGANAEKRARVVKRGFQKILTLGKSGDRASTPETPT